MKNLMTPALENLFTLLNGQVYFVGGAVRDMLMNRPVHDIDLATPLTPNQVVDCLKDADVHIHPTGIDHGTLTLVLSDKSVVEITSFRNDVKTDGRHAKVVFGQDIKQDALRRDFTINALYVDGAGKVLDFVGGLKDLKKKRLRFIGHAETRIKEDALRVLRYFRFLAQTGIKKPDLTTLKACRNGRDLLDVLSKERVRDQMLKLLTVPDPQKSLFFMARSGVLKKIVGDYDLFALRKLLKKERLAGFQTDALFRLWVLCKYNLPAWPITRNQKKQAQLWQAGMQMPFCSNSDCYNALYLLGKEAFLNVVLLKKKKMSFAAFRFFFGLKIPKPPFDAKDVADFFNVKDGDLGQKMKLCEDVWMKMDRPTKKEVVFKQILR